MASQQQNSKTIPLKVLVDKNSNKVVFVEATEDFVETIFSFLSLPLPTIVRLLATATNNNSDQQSESSPFLGNIKNLYQSVQNINSNDIWSSPACKQMLLRPRNPWESLLKELFLNIDDTESIEFFVCDSCYKFTTFQNLKCTCGKLPNRKPRNLDSEGQGNNAKNGVFLRRSGTMFLVSD
ncbi:30S ribosomal protein s18, partial [Trifolium pratense]